MFALRLSDLGVVVLLAAIAAIWPSLLSAFYFLCLLVLCTWWAAHRPMRRRVYTMIKLTLLAYVCLHLSLLYLYQMTVQVPVKDHLGVGLSEHGNIFVNSSLNLVIR